MGCAVAVLVMTFTCLCLALAGNLAGLIGQSWFKTSSRQWGILRWCDENQQCKFYENLFKTDDAVLTRFIVIVLLIGSCGFLFLALLSSLTMCCCQKSRGMWTCGALLTSIFSFLGAGTGLAALIYYEVDTKMFDIYERGWSNIVCWTGSSVGALAYILTNVMMCCAKPQKYSGGEVNVVVNPPYAPTAPSYPMVSRGYTHGF